VVSCYYITQVTAIINYWYCFQAAAPWNLLHICKVLIN